MSEKIMPMSEAIEGYELFDKMKVQKGMSPVFLVKISGKADKTKWFSKHKSNEFSIIA